MYASLELESNHVDRSVKTILHVRDGEKPLPSLDDPIQVKPKTMTDSGLPNTSASQLNMDFVDKKIYYAFGVTLITTTDFQASN